jgi:hypothetical protein
MTKRETEKAPWETPSLDWIHAVRRARHAERAGRPPRALSSDESERLAKKYGLKLARQTTVR